MIFLRQDQITTSHKVQAKKIAVCYMIESDILNLKNPKKFIQDL
jgi:hypothetical protein